MDRISPLVHTPAIVAAIDEPMIAPNLFQLWELASRARDEGIGVLLGGHDGDTVVSHGFAILSELVLAEDWVGFDRELCLLSEFLGDYHGARRALVAQYAVPCVRYLISRGVPLQALRTAARLRSRYGVLLRSLLGVAAPDIFKRVVRSIRAARGSVGLRQLARPVRSSLRIQKMLPRSYDNWQPSVAKDHLRAVTLPLLAESFEYFDRIGAAFGVEHRHPFFDKRLVEFCLALPAHHKVRAGWTRIILREATEGILPEEIRLRRDKSNLGHNLALSMRNDGTMLKAAFDDARAEFQKYWDVAKLQRTRQVYVDSPNAADAFSLLLAYSHSVWLKGSC